MSGRILLAVAALCGLLSQGSAQTNFQRLKSFGFPANSGPCNPRASLIYGSDGALYGTTDVGGANYVGTVYKLNCDGSDCVVLHGFSKLDGDGWGPNADLIEGADGALYGTTSRGGGNDRGTVFRLNKDGGGYAVLRAFALNGSEGVGPRGGLTEGSDGALYGTTAYGGGNNSGLIFKLNKDGSGFAILRNFAGPGADAQTPYATMIEASDAALYGTTYAGGISNKGTVFKLNKNGSGYQVMHSFGSSAADGANPWAGLTEGNDGVLYGMTFSGGAGNLGTIFKLRKDGTDYTVLRSFAGASDHDGKQPYGALLKAADGSLYGTTYFGSDGFYDCGAVFRLDADGNGFSILHSFVGVSVAEGQNPIGALVQGADGALYGTAYSGGGYFAGTVFKLNQDGSGYQTIRSFLSAGGDGQNPTGALTEGSDGALYGTTQSGGSNNFGTVYKLDRNGSNYAILRHFSTAGDALVWPYAPLLEGSDGALYGTTKYGGYAYGGVFRLTKDGGDYQVLHTFSYEAGEAMYPEAGLIEGADGALYGTTLYGGTSQAGTVFTLHKDGTGYAVLRSFTGSAGDGRSPSCAVTEASDGTLYGTTQAGGASGQGTVFKLNKDGAGYSVLRSFLANGDGACPYASLLEGSDGALYGTTSRGGEKGCGTVFRLTKDGNAYTLLRSFTGLMDDGASPWGGLVEGKDGALYGTSVYSVFKLSKDGTGYTVLRSFPQTLDAVQEQNLRGPLVSGADGKFYGIASSGGSMGLGTVFKLFSTAPAPALSRLVQNGAGSILLTWSAIPNLTYQVQYATDLVAPNWIPLASNVTATSNSASQLDVSDAVPRRFYRVQWIP